jgi:hypothetical protein
MAVLGIGAKTKLAELEKIAPIIASAARVQLENPSWKNYSMVDEGWQRDAWFYYNIIGAFNYAANWVGNACGRAEIYVADVDELGVVGNRTENKEVAAIADTLFGGPTTKQQIVKSIAVSLTVAGECYVIGRGGKPGTGRDQWNVVAPYMVRPYQGGIWLGHGTGYSEKIPNGSALLFRVWNPRDDEPWYSVSPGKACLLTLRELEQIAKFKAAQTDSRLANAGIYPIPNDIDFTYGDAEAGVPSLQAALIEAINASLEGKGSAAQISPLLLGVDPEVLQYIFKEPIRFGSVMSDQIRNLEEVALQQLAITMSLPPEIVLGTGTSNQWSAWEIGESAVKYHIEPMMNLIIDAINISYLAPAVKRLGKDPARYTFQVDTSALTVRPNRYTDALNAYNAEVPAISAEALRFYGDFKEADAPSDEELLSRLIQQLLRRDPQLVMDPELAAGTGFDIKTSLPVESTTPPPPTPDLVAKSGKQPMPARPAETVAKTPSIIAAQVAAVTRVGEPSALLAAASAEVRSALYVAGKRMINPQTRREFGDIEPHLMHTKLKVADDEAAQRLTAGAFEGLQEAVEGTGVDPVQLRALLAAYTHSLLKRSVPHDRNMLAHYMAEHGLKPWQN